ncbi:MAG: HD domain-containing protein [Gemmatimonadota bacterium]|nr:HD domain-containing protein [Gemmatimonadota bacterium]
MTGERSVAATILGAALFAAEKHSTQRRKDAAASPYITHPVAVAEVVARHGVSDPVVLQAALLHAARANSTKTNSPWTALQSPPPRPRAHINCSML